MSGTGGPRCPGTVGDECERRGTVTPPGLASWMVMTTSSSRRFPVTVTHLPLTRCEICNRTVAYRPGKVSEALTEHYRRAHPQALRLPGR